MTFGDRVKQLRAQRGFSLRDVWLKSEGLITPSGMLRIENNERKNPRLSTLIALAKSLDSIVAVTSDGVAIEPRENFSNYLKKINESR